MTRLTADAADALAWQINAAKLGPVVREHRFHPTRRWRFDIAFPDAMLAVEVDGAVWTGGRHVRGSGYAGDCLKIAEATLLGWTVLRFTAQQVDDGTALGYVEKLIVTPLVPRLPDPEAAGA